MTDDQLQPCPHCGEPYDRTARPACPKCALLPDAEPLFGAPGAKKAFEARGVEYATASYVRAIVLLLFGLILGSALGTAAVAASASRNSGLGGFLGIAAAAMFLGFLVRAATVYGEGNGHLGK